jgi:hypothetical protein
MPTDATTLQQVRSALYLYLSPEVAAAAAMTVADLQQTIAGAYRPTEKQLHTLARIMRLLDG